MMLQLRDYQVATIDGLSRTWHSGVQRPAIVLPTGAGKTVVFAHLAKMAAEADLQTLVLAHRDELVAQAVDKIASVAPEVPVGVVKGERRETDRPVVVASVWSLRQQPQRAALGRRGLVVVDECHHATALTYQRVLSDLGAFDEGSGVLAMGCTATLARADRGPLRRTWPEVAHRVELLDLVRQGYLCTARGVRVRMEGLDLRGVARAGGDWTDRGLGAALDAVQAPRKIAEALLEHAADRQSIVFVPSVALAHATATAVASAGLAAVAIDGGTDPQVRRDQLAAYRRGEVRVLVNCAVFTEGTDLPMTDCVVIGRPTSSGPLFVQMAGRGLRPWPGKKDCLVMDLVGVTGRHRLASLVDLTGGAAVEALTPEQRAELAELEAERGLDLLGLDAAADVLVRGLSPTGADGQLTYEPVDLFERSRQQWLRTHGGTWFLAVGDRLVFLRSAGERWDVADVPVGRAGGRWVAQQLPDLSYAMSWGEQAAGELQRDLGYRVDKQARWRREKPTAAQLDLLARLGVPAQEGWSRSDASDAISMAKASRRLDHLPMLAGAA